MNDTVRNAVFGNVGTMISFRVSADDSPILAKQFEPQFEPNDLLQMNNRDFIINMVINGEKSPAFSARTLNLPPAQTDLTLKIIEQTRIKYSRSREEIEHEINRTILDKTPPQNQTTIANPPQSITPQAAVQPTVAPSTVASTPKPAEPVSDAPRKKRTRTRRKKAETTTIVKQSSTLIAEMPKTIPKAATENKDETTFLQLR